MSYDDLVLEAEKEGIKVIEYKFKSARIKGLYSDGVITLNSAINCTTAEKKCILAEEIGHYQTSYGNILDQKDTGNLKQEKKARNWAYEKLVPVSKLIEAYKSGVTNRYELAEFLDLSEEFLNDAVAHYRDKYGKYIKHGNYLIYFEPLGVLKIIE